MYLFVGNLSKSVKTSDLEAEFEKFGPCKVNIPKVPTQNLFLSARSQPPEQVL